MKLFIPKDMFDNPCPPRIFLCTTGKKIIGELPVYDVSFDGKWNAYSELTFSIDRKYPDIITGETKVHPLFDKTEGLRKVYVENIGYFVVQDPKTIYADKDTKTLSCFSSEYETGTKYLESFRVNTGDVDSKEVIYLSKIYGENYTIDTPYTLATGEYDAYESYYIQDYTGSEADSYVYQQVEIADASKYAEYDGSTVAKTLYVKKYPNVRFYYPTKPELSLLHLIFEKIPDWTIGHVDATLWRKERKCDEDRIAVYDFLMNEVSDTFKCVVEWDTLTNTVNFYEEAEDGVTTDNTIQTRFETDVYISRENLASEINISYSTDNIKTKLKVSGADDLNIREVNLGKNYIMNLDFFHTPDWMEPDLIEAYSAYLNAVSVYSPQYTEAMTNWVSAYNKWNDLMYAVPAEGNVVLIGDEFKKLYCLYTPIDTAYLNRQITSTDINTTVDDLYSDNEYKTVIDKSKLSDGETFVVQGYSFVYVSADSNFKCVVNMTETNLNGTNGLRSQLKLHRIDEDTTATKSDNILLTLTNKASDRATIRIYYDETQADYMIQSVIVRAHSGLTDAPSKYTINSWINGELTTSNKNTNGMSNLDGFTVSSIGVMGAYFVLAKDESVKANLTDYGVKLLQEKQATYTKIFQVQTEAMFSQEKYQCTASDEPPTGTIAEGTRWLDTDSNPVQLYKYIGNQWVLIANEENPTDLINYQRYLDNYEKLQAVQEILVEKEREAQYWQYGFLVPNRYISGPNIAESSMQLAAQQHFGDKYTIGRVDYDPSIPLYTFVTSHDPDHTYVVYLQNGKPYVAFAGSQGVYQALMQFISDQVEMENFFTKEQWIRLSPFIREDEFSDSNFLLTGYESEEERLKIYKELLDAATKELKTLSQPSLEFSMTMANILALPEFKSLIEQFQLGNFVRVHIRDGYVKRSRLLEVHLTFDDLSDFSATFGNLITTKSEIDKHAELLSQAVTAGKQVAASAGDWQKAVDKSNKLEEDIADGLANAALEVGRANGQNIVWDQTGIWGRKLIDGTTDQYEDEQFRIINNKLVFSNDGFKTSKSVMGRFVVKDDDGNDVTRWGLLAEAMVGGYIEGSEIRGGNLRIGDGSQNYFQVDESGSVSIVEAGKEKYASVDAVKVIDDAYRYQIVLSYDNSTIFGRPNQTCTLTCKVYELDEDITSKLPSGTQFSWLRNGSVYKTTTVPTLTVTNSDVDGNSIFACSVTFDETQIQ